MTILKFEELFQKANQILFFGTNNNPAEPLIISTLFREKDQAYEAYEAYEFLVENLTKDEICLLIRIVDDYYLNLSFIDKTNSNVYNIDNIPFLDSNFQNFKKESEIGKSFGFLLMHLIEESPCAILKPGSTPLTIKELVFEE